MRVREGMSGYCMPVLGEIVFQEASLLDRHHTVHCMYSRQKLIWEYAWTLYYSVFCNRIGYFSKHEIEIEASIVLISYNFYGKTSC